MEEAVRHAAREHDLWQRTVRLVFAQASMARLVPRLEGQLAVPLLSSPALAMRRVAAMLASPTV